MLSLFDLDKTLVPFNEEELYPQAIELLNQAAQQGPIAIVTNQGGPACRDAGWGDKFPTIEDVTARLGKISDEIEAIIGYQPFVYYCLVYQSKDGQLMWPKGVEKYKDSHTNVQANPRFRKPAPGMILQAMIDYKSTPETTVMYGDSADDEGAALAAGVRFVKVDFTG